MRFSANQLSAGLTGISGAGLAAAAYLQHVMGYQPCTICVIQRYLLVCCFAVGLLSLLTKKGWWFQMLAAGSALAGLIVGVTRVIKPPSNTCGRDAVAAMLNERFPAQAVPSFFEVRGGCADVYPNVMGLSMNGWSIVIFAVMFLIASALASQRIKGK